jgi:hypothetical protein
MHDINRTSGRKKRAQDTADRHDDKRGKPRQWRELESIGEASDSEGDNKETQCDKGRAPGEFDQECRPEDHSHRHGNEEPSKLSPIDLLPFLSAKDQRGDQVQTRLQRDCERQGQEVCEHRRGNQWRAEACETEDDVCHQYG